MEKQNIQQQSDYKKIMKARSEGLLVQSENEFREEQHRVMENHIRQRQSLFDGFYGGMVTPKQRNEYYNVIERERRKHADQRNTLYPKAVIDKMQTIRGLIEELRTLGVHEAAILDLIRPERPISRIYITADYRIFLPEFGNIELALGPMPKLVFLFFLRHPEGIIIKHIGQYFTELMDIYKGIVGSRFNAQKAEKSLNRICNPVTNSINENISRIHEALRGLLDETIAFSYFIQGKRGGIRQILIPQPLISWETDF